MKNITRNELLTVGLFAAFVFIATVTVSFGQNFNLGPVSAMSRYFAQAVSTIVSPVAPATVNSTQRTTQNSMQTVTTAQVSTKITQCNDGIDNDKDGDADVNDYSCAKGITEDSLEKKLDPQLTAMAWPGGPRFANRQQCNNYCKAILTACEKPLREKRDADMVSCRTGNGCDAAGPGCFDPGRRTARSTCNYTACNTCEQKALDAYNPQSAQCTANYQTCTQNCRAMFPDTPSTAPATTIQ